MSQKTIHKPNTKQAKIPKKGESPKKSNTIQPPINEVVQEKIEELKESYDNFLYVSKAFSNTNINSLQARGRLYGLSPASLKGARVLELGSSCGGNIIPQALYYPETTFTGIDLSGVQIEHGKALIESIGLTNITLLEKNIMDIDDDFGTFDYIIVHGIWSWVPDMVKDKILSICNRNLSDRGIVYVSYNTYPGWKRLEQLRDIMLYSEKHAPTTSLQDRTAYTKQVLQLIQETMKLDERSRMKSSYKIPNIDRVLKANDYYVGHEYLESINDPVYVSEFVKRAESQGCAYVGDECMQRSFITWLPDATVTNIKKLAQDNRVDKEQYFDYVYDTQFRMSLLTKQSNAAKITQNETVTKDILDGLYFLITLDTDLGVPPEWTDTVHIAIKEMMDTRLPFSVQDVVDHIEHQYPGYDIDMDKLYTRLFLLVVIGQLYTFGERYEHLPFKENETYVPQRFIDYIATLIEKDGNRYMTTANMYNQIDYDVEHGVLYIMRLFTTPTTKEKLIENLDVNVTVERTTKDGQQYRVPSEQYLDEVLRHLRVLGFFRKK